MKRYYVIMTKSSGEKSYADKYIFKSIVKPCDHEDLKDFLYKYAFNLNEAYQYLGLVKQTLDTHPGIKTELIYRIYAMGLQCFALSVRKITDTKSKRSLRRLINLAVKPALAAEHKNKISDIYTHYEKFLNKFVVHQDLESIHEGIGFFPETEVIDNDLNYLREYYLTLTQEICVSYMDVTGNPSNFTNDLAKLST